MDNSVFVDDENIPMVHQQDEDYDDYRTPDTSGVDETSFIDTTEATSTLWLRQKVKRDKIIGLYKYPNVTGDIDLINQNRFKLTTDPGKGATIFEFYNSDRWISLTKQTGDFFTPKALRDRLGGLNTMKNFLGLDEMLPTIERSLKATSKLKSELPTDL